MTKKNETVQVTENGEVPTGDSFKSLSSDPKSPKDAPVASAGVSGGAGDSDGKLTATTASKSKIEDDAKRDSSKAKGKGSAASGYAGDQKQGSSPSNKAKGKIGRKKSSGATSPSNVAKVTAEASNSSAAAKGAKDADESSQRSESASPQTKPKAPGADNAGGASAARASKHESKDSTHSSGLSSSEEHSTRDSIVPRIEGLSSRKSVKAIVNTSASSNEPGKAGPERSRTMDSSAMRESSDYVYVFYFKLRF